MNSVILTQNFKKGYKQIVKKYPAFRQDMEALLTSLENNALQGVEPFPNVRKIRVAITGKMKGKSGGARVIVYVHVKENEVYCLYVYDKAEIADIPDHEIKDFVKELMFHIEENTENEE